MRALLLVPLLASGGVTVDFTVFTFAAQFVLFILFMLVMKPLVFQPLVRVFEERERRTAGAIQEARQMDDQAIALKQELDRKMDGIRRKAAVDRDRYRNQIKALEAETMESARQAVDEKLTAGQSRIGQEIGGIRQELEAQRRQLAADIASRVLGREVKA